MEAVARENYNRRAAEWTVILACVIGCAKEVVVSKSHKIARVAYLGQITNIGGGRVRNLLKERSREGRDISVRIGHAKKDAVLESCGIAQVA